MNYVNKNYEKYQIERQPLLPIQSPKPENLREAFNLDNKVTESFKKHLAYLIADGPPSHKPSHPHAKSNVSSEAVKSMKQSESSESSSVKRESSMFRTVLKNLKKAFLGHEDHAKVAQSTEKVFSDEKKIEESTFESMSLDQPNLSGEPDSKGKSISNEYRDQEGVVFIETAERAETVDILLKGLKAKLRSLPVGSEAYKKVVAEIKYHEANTAGATWSSTNSPRFIFKKRGKVQAKQSYSPIACNLRMQKIEIPEKQADGSIKMILKSSVVRSAALSDFGNGNTNSKEMLYYLARLKNPQPSDNADKKLNEIKLNIILAYGKDVLSEESANSIKTILDKINKDQSLSKSDLKLLKSIEIDLNKLESVIQARSKLLETTFLQDLYTQYKTKPVKNDSPVYIRISLLDPEKSPRNDYGCILKEESQLLDMQVLLDKMQDREILFDGENSDGPYIDDKGRIHMPKDCAAEGVTKANLNTVLVNVSAQGNTKNRGIQKEINEEAIRKMRSLNMDPTQIDVFENSLNLLNTDSIDPFQVGFLAYQCGESVDAHSAVNCYGGKDRTGALLALITLNYLKKVATKENLKKWSKQLISKQGVAAQVAKDNADHSVLKLSRFNLEIYKNNKIERIKHLFAASILGFKANILNRITTSDSPGQLYRT